MLPQISMLWIAGITQVTSASVYPNLNCPSDDLDQWIKHNTSCYLLSNTTASRDDAQDNCSELNANLVSINSQEENDYVMNLTRGYSVWIGLSHGAQRGCTLEEEREDWLWEDGTDYVYNASAGQSLWYSSGSRYEPKNDQLCGGICYNNSQLYTGLCDKNCDKELFYVCKNTTDGDTCQPSFEFNNSACYYFSSSMKEYDDAQTDCQNRSSSLASVTSKEEAEFISSRNKRPWIGLYREKTCETRLARQNSSWMDNSTYQYQNWSPQEPDIFTQCIMMSGGGEWEDTNCDNALWYVCKKPTGCQPWQKWSPCSSTCGRGTKRRKRVCKLACEGKTTENGMCYEEECPKNSDQKEMNSADESVAFKQEDNRPSAICIGVTCIIIISVILGTSALNDLPTIYSQIRYGVQPRKRKKQSKKKITKQNA